MSKCGMKRLRASHILREVIWASACLACIPLHMLLVLGVAHGTSLHECDPQVGHAAMHLPPEWSEPGRGFSRVVTSKDEQLCNKWLGVRVTRRHMRFNEFYPASLAERPSRTIQIFEVGWPFMAIAGGECLNADMVYIGGWRLGTRDSCCIVPGVSVAFREVAGSPRQYPPVTIAMPYWPLWAGAVGNWAVYYSCSRMTAECYRGWVRFRRGRRGKCKMCGYSVVDLRKCPECGYDVPHARTR